ncbi:hypothetical protein OQA88_13409 [Cercophora sp. LCS_1]
MRLLNAKTQEFEEFFGGVGASIPPYAILSHRWGEDEVSFEQHKTRQYYRQAGYAKIYGCCRAAEDEGLQYVWIDTCCINKASSAELSEAINSMFNWYRAATLCFAYLSDVDSSEDPAMGNSTFSRSKWFSRGWTLQELLAPAHVVFLGSDWVEIGTRNSLRAVISRVTGIDESVLLNAQWDKYSVAQKMSWAASRETTRPEDEAYCLLGLFNIQMPLLYGEGRRAFTQLTDRLFKSQRLQEEILKQSHDESLFAWTSSGRQQESYSAEIDDGLSGVLASSPRDFRFASKVEIATATAGTRGPESTFEVVHGRLRMTLPFLHAVNGISLGKLSDSLSSISLLESTTTRATVSAKLDSSSKQQPHTHHNRQAFFYRDQGHDVAEIRTWPIKEYSASAGSSAVPFEGEAGGGANAVGLDTQDRHQSEERGWNWNENFLTWTIYRPAIVAPLQCQIDGQQLGIVLFRSGDRSGEAAALVRCPPLVVLSQDTPSVRTTTEYAVIFTTRPTITLADRPMSVQEPTFKYVRVAKSPAYSSSPPLPLTVSNGGRQHLWRLSLEWRYIIFRSTAAPNMTAPWFLFAAPDTFDEQWFPWVFLPRANPALPRGGQRFTSRSNAANSSPTPQTMAVPEQLPRLFSFDLAREDEIQLSIGGGLALVVRRRRTPDSSYIKVSIEAWKMGRPRALMVTGKVGRLFEKSALSQLRRHGLD